MDTTNVTAPKLLDPNRVKADHNYRFSLMKSKIEAMKNAIIRDGGVTTPIEVEPLKGDPNYDYLVVVGHYRLAGTLAANKENAGLQLPAFVLPPQTPRQRLERQLAENMDRENNSPIDEAKAIKALFDEGAERIEIRTRFQRRGSSKPASNSFINMTMSFLDLPKAVQKKIHEGTVGVGAAYELVKAFKVAQAKGLDPAETVNTIVQRAEAEVARRVEAEDREEARYLEAEQKAEENRIAAEAAQKVVDAKGAEFEAAATAAAEAQHAVEQAFKAKAKAKAAADKKQADEVFRAAEKTAKDAERAVELKKKELEKATGVVEKYSKPVAVPAPAPASSKSVGAANIRTAAASVGATEGAVPLNITQIRALIKSLTLAGVFPIVKTIGQALEEAINGVTTENQLHNKLAVITGEKKPATKAAKGGKAA